MYDEDKCKLNCALGIVSRMTVEEFQTELEKHKIECNTIDNYVFDLAKAIKESANGRKI